MQLAVSVVISMVSILLAIQTTNPISISANIVIAVQEELLVASVT